jgi:hypothetical protein
MTFLLGTWLRAMKRHASLGATARRGAKHPHPKRVVPRLEALEDRTVPSILTVTSAADDGSAGTLRAVIGAASSGATINFDPSLAGQTITLTGGELAITQSLDIEGLGADQLTVSGNDAGRVFDVSTGATVTIAGMTITDGLANGGSPGLTSAGGGILNFGDLTLSGDVLSDNQAVGDAVKVALGNRPGGAVGGALVNLGALTVSDSTFTGNEVLGFDGRSGTSAGNASGGAILNAGAATITDSQFTFNVGHAGSQESGSMSATGSAGAISNTGSLTIARSTFSHNLAIGGDDSSGTVRPGAAIGGAILSGGPTGPVATLVVSGSTFEHNQAIGGNGNQSATNPAPSLNGPNDAFGGAIHLSAGTANMITACTIAHNAAIAGAGGAGQDGGLAWGGGLDLFNSFGHGVSATVSNCTISHNSVTGGAGGPGGEGGYAWGGGLANFLGAALTVSDSTVEHNLAVGGAGGLGDSGGDGQGGGIFEDGNALSTLTLTGDMIDRNLAIGGAAGLGGSDGEGVGGGLYVTPGGVACADVLTVIAHNHATTSDDDVFGDLGLC